MSGSLRGFAAGIKMGLGKSPFVPNFKKIAAGTVGAAGKEVIYLSEHVEERKEACKEAKQVYTNTYEAFLQYAKEHPSSIGTDIYKNREDKCKAFLKSYYRWLGDILLSEAGEIKATSTITMPKMVMPSMPTISVFGKGAIGIIVAIGVVIVMLLAVGYSGLGGSIGSHLEK